MDLHDRQFPLPQIIKNERKVVEKSRKCSEDDGLIHFLKRLLDRSPTPPTVVMPIEMDQSRISGPWGRALNTSSYRVESRQHLCRHSQFGIFGDVDTMSIDKRQHRSHPTLFLNHGAAVMSWNGHGYFNQSGAELPYHSVFTLDHFTGRGLVVDA